MEFVRFPHAQVGFLNSNFSHMTKRMRQVFNARWVENPNEAEAGLPLYLR